MHFEKHEMGRTLGYWNTGIVLVGKGGHFEKHKVGGVVLAAALVGRGFQNSNGSQAAPGPDCQFSCI